MLRWPHRRAFQEAVGRSGVFGASEMVTGAVEWSGVIWCPRGRTPRWWRRRCRGRYGGGNGDGRRRAGYARAANSREGALVLLIRKARQGDDQGAARSTSPTALAAAMVALQARVTASPMRRMRPGLFPHHRNRLKRILTASAGAAHPGALPVVFDLVHPVGPGGRLGPSGKRALTHDAAGRT
jgi:hypothetical protein